MARRLALGIDFGTDSARALVADVDSGAEVAAAVAPYRRWARGDYCDPDASRFRQHPRDHLEALVACVAGALAQAGAGAGGEVAGIGIDTTGSTPVAVDAEGTALAMHERFADNPAAMFVLWKDHSAIAEAARINELAHSGRHEDVTRYVGGIYSPEWYWAKALRVLGEDAAVAAAAAGWVEHCDWLPGVLTGRCRPRQLARSRCAAGHKAMWHAAWGGLPPAAFLAELDPRLPALRAAYAPTTMTSDQAPGALTAAWAARLGLRPGIAVAVGAFDAHLGAVGAGAGAYVLTKVMGTSTCDMMVAPPSALTGTVRGICGQVDGSIIPGMIGLEAGQSAFGDVYAWFRRLLSWPLEALGAGGEGLGERLLPALEAAALRLPPAGGVLAVDWFNGRRSPDADARLQGALSGLTLAADAPALYRALVEGTGLRRARHRRPLRRAGRPGRARDRPRRHRPALGPGHAGVRRRPRAADRRGRERAVLRPRRGDRGRGRRRLPSHHCRGAGAHGQPRRPHLCADRCPRRGLPGGVPRLPCAWRESREPRRRRPGRAGGGLGCAAGVRPLTGQDLASRSSSDVAEPAFSRAPSLVSKDSTAGPCTEVAICYVIVHSGKSLLRS